MANYYFNNATYNLRAGEQDDFIFGNNWANAIYSGGGDDYIDAAGGDDDVAGQHGNETILGRDGNDRLRGESGNDTIYGGNGNDVIEGGLDFDMLFGGNGADRFDFNSMAELNTDVIRDFSGQKGGQRDRLDVSTIDANVNVAGNQAFFEYKGTGKQPVGSYKFTLDRDGDTDVTFYDGRVKSTVELTGDIWIMPGDFIV